MKAITTVFTVISILMIGSCSHHAQKTPSNMPVYTACKEPRPEICTMEYAPVCANIKPGTQCEKAPCSGKNHITYSNGCSACADIGVQSYQVGPCQDE